MKRREAVLQGNAPWQKGPYTLVLGSRRRPDEIVGPTAPQTGFDPNETARRMTFVADLNAAYLAGVSASPPKQSPERSGGGG